MAYFRIFLQTKNFPTLFRREESYFFDNFVLLFDHFTLFGVGHMVVAEKMQYRVNGEIGYLALDAVSEFFCLLFTSVVADYNVAEHDRFVIEGHYLALVVESGEGKHVGHAVLIAKIPIERSYLLAVDEGYRHLALTRLIFIG